MSDDGIRRNSTQKANIVTNAAHSETEFDIVGHKTFATGEKDEHGFPKMRHEPLTRGEADAMWESAEKAKAERNARMPDEQSAIKALFDAWYRLKDFNWNDPSYCPKDGSRFNILELGSTGIHTGYYQGEWPKGSWWVEDAYDLYPSHPALFKLFPEDQAKRDKQFADVAARFRAARDAGEFDVAMPNSVSESEKR